MDELLRRKIALYVLRGIFFACSMGTALYIAETLNNTGQYEADPYWFMMFGGCLAFIVIIAEVFFSKSSISTISSIVFGLLIGFITSYLFIGIISLMVVDLGADRHIVSILKIVSTLIFCYYGIAILLQTQDDFRFIIPYVEFRKDLRGPLPLIIDTSILIDGRIQKLLELDFLDNRIIIPHFVIEETQKLADSPDKFIRERGKRGLEVLNHLIKSKAFGVEISTQRFPAEKEVDQKLLKLCETLQGKILTNDQNLAEVAKIYGIKVLSLNHLFQALKVEWKPGDEFEIEIIKKGENPKQGVGYLEDGTLVVVDGGSSYIGEKVFVRVRNVLQTGAGKMVFASLKEKSREDSQGRQSESTTKNESQNTKTSEEPSKSIPPKNPSSPRKANKKSSKKKAK
ncbi:MAG: TRAM domain-containing protein [Planctomycetota bacterium]|nr:MAG: TRAM domain-containing protein [Planctomycetota bacterium]